MNRFSLSALFIVLLLTFSVIPVALADGGIMIREPLGWRMLKEGNQLAAINYKNGFENLIIAVNTGEPATGDKAVWIFPVPAKPEQTTINILEGFPLLYGTSLEERAQESIKLVADVSRGSQIYTLPFMFMGRMFFGRSLKIEGGLEIPGVTVHETVTKLGVTTELVSARSGEALAQYVNSKDLDIPQEFQTILDEYIGQEYSFVVSWVSDPGKFTSLNEHKEMLDLINQGKIEEAIEMGASSNDNSYRVAAYLVREGNVEEAKRILERGSLDYFESDQKLSEAISVSVTFPTEKMYYPLKPTSVYGSDRVPTTVFVMEYVKPELYEGIKADSEVKYYQQSSYIPSEDLQEFFFGNEVINNFKYTEVKLNPVSKLLTEDLWFERGAPVKVSVQNYFANQITLNWIIFFILCSLIASTIAGMVVFKRKTIFFGLFNFLSLIGFIIVTYFWNFEGVDKKVKNYVRNYSNKLFESRNYYKILGVAIAVSVAWLILGRFRLDFFGVLLSVIMVVGYIVIAFVVSSEKINDKYRLYFKDIEVKCVNLKRLLFLIIFNVGSSLLLIFITLFNSGLARSLATVLGFVRGTYNYPMPENLVPLIISLVFTVSILMLTFFPMNSKMVHVRQKNVKKFWFVLLFTVFFTAATFLLQYILYIII